MLRTKTEINTSLLTETKEVQQQYVGTKVKVKKEKVNALLPIRELLCQQDILPGLSVLRYLVVTDALDGHTYLNAFRMRVSIGYLSI